MANNISFGGGNGGGGSSTLSGLSDVTLSSPTNGQVLKYDGSKWVNGAGGGSSEHNYSTTEQVVGTWIDGKPLYQLTCVGGAVSAGQSVSVDLTDYSIDTFVGVDSGASMFIRENFNDIGYSLNGNELQDSQWGILVYGSSSALTVNTRNFGLSSWFATIRYTKSST